MEILKREKLMSTKLRERHGNEVLGAIARGAKLSPLTDEKIHRTRKDFDCLGDEQRAVYEALRNWRKRAAVKRTADASLVLPRSAMLELARLRARPRDVDGLRNCGILEPWRVDYYGEGILSAFHDAATADQGSAARHRGGDAADDRHARSMPAPRSQGPRPVGSDGMPGRGANQGAGNGRKKRPRRTRREAGDSPTQGDRDLG
jgi:ribonuclease D